MRGPGTLGGVPAALHTPGGGHVDPPGAAFALATAARSWGATVRGHERVLGMRRLNSDEG